MLRWSLRILSLLLIVSLTLSPVSADHTMLGDLDYDDAITAADALRVLQSVVKLITLSGDSFYQGDVNGDGEVTTVDALMILQSCVGLIDGFARQDSFYAGRVLNGIFTGETTEILDETTGDIALQNADMVWVGNTLYAYYPTEEGIALATSVDGISFEKKGIAVPKNGDFWAEGGAENPSIFVDEGTFYLAYDGHPGKGPSSICLATSTDGVSFESQGEIFYYSGTGLEAVGISQPELFKSGSTWFLTYTADGGDDPQICLAISMQNPYRFSRLSSTSILPTAAQGYDSGATGRRDVIYADGYFYMVYSTATEVGEADAATASWSHSFARSSDGFHWMPLGRILTEGTESGFGMDLPCFVIQDARVFVYYRHGNSSRRTELIYDPAMAPQKTPPVDTTSPAVAALLDGLFTGKTTEVKDAEEVGGAFKMHFPDFLRVGDEIWAYYIGSNAEGKMSTCLATSKDGVNFTKQGVVVQPSSEQTWDDSMAAFAGVWYEDGVFYLTYEGSGTDCNGNIGLATSTDGIHFQKQGCILKSTQIGLERMNIGTPDLYKEGDTWYLFYHAYDGQTCQICVATGPDLFHLTRCEGNPIIPSRPGTYESGTTGRRDIIYSGGWYYMVYEVSTEMPYASAKWGHNFARSKDLIHWETLPEPIYPITESGMGHDGPAWLVDGDDVYVYIREPGNYTTRLKLAPITQ